MILVDSNIPMYLVGPEHGLKEAARRVMEVAVGDGERLVSDVEVLQEILHRYSSIRRAAAIQPAFDALLDVVDEVLPVELADVQRARDIVQGGYPLSARDALHIAVMQRHRVDAIMSFDCGFDRFPGITRLA